MANDFRIGKNTLVTRTNTSPSKAKKIRKKIQKRLNALTARRKKWIKDNPEKAEKQRRERVQKYLNSLTGE